MRMPFGPHKGLDLDQVPDSTLNWIDAHFETEPRDSTPPNLRDEYRMKNVELKNEARRIMRERRMNGVQVADPPGTSRTKMNRRRRS